MIMGSFFSRFGLNILANLVIVEIFQDWIIAQSIDEQKIVRILEILDRLCFGALDSSISTIHAHMLFGEVAIVMGYLLA